MNSRQLVLGLALWLALCSWISAQSLPAGELTTELETLATTTGAVVIKGASEIGKISTSGAGPIFVTARENKIYASERREMGISIVVSPGSDLEARSFIDFQELPDLIKGIEVLLGSTTSMTQLDDLEAVYSTRSGFQVIAYQRRRNNWIAIELGNVKRTRIWMSGEDLEQLKSLIIKAQDKLAALKK